MSGRTWQFAEWKAPESYIDCSARPGGALIEGPAGAYEAAARIAKIIREDAR
jgi:hypothetical protein